MRASVPFMFSEKIGASWMAFARSKDVFAFIHVVAASRHRPWGYVEPSADDFANPRLLLLTVLPQIGGLVLMVLKGPICSELFGARPSPPILQLTYSIRKCQFRRSKRPERT